MFESFVGHDLVKAPMTSLKQDTQNRVMKIVASNTGYSLSGLAWLFRS